MCPRSRESRDLSRRRDLDLDLERFRDRLLFRFEREEWEGEPRPAGDEYREELYFRHSKKLKEIQSNTQKVHFFDILIKK